MIDILEVDQTGTNQIRSSDLGLEQQLQLLEASIELAIG